MATKTTDTKKAVASLIVEPHPTDYVGFPFITLIQYRKQPMLAIIDNADGDTIRAFILDLCGPERVDEEMLISIASEWYDFHRNSYPLSVEFSKRGLSHITSKIYRTLNVEFVSRIIGPAPKYPMKTVKSVKRKRKRPISPGVEIHENVILAQKLFK